MLTFVEAIKQANIFELEDNLRAGINPNLLLKGFYPLQLAVSFLLEYPDHTTQNQLIIIEKLLTAGAVPNIPSEGISLIHQLICGNHYFNSRWLSLFNSNEKELDENSRWQAIELLIKHGADIDVLTADEADSPIIKALFRREAIIAIGLLRHGAEVDITLNNTRLPIWHLACDIGSLALLECLIDRQININEIDANRDSAFEYLSKKSELNKARRLHVNR